MDGNETRRVGRRALLAAGAAGVAAAAAQAVAPAQVLAGGDHQPVMQGEANDGTLTTVVTAPGNNALEGRSDVGDGLRGISKGAGKSGVYGYSSNADGYGVFGRNESGGTAGTGVLGHKSCGVKGDSGAGEGVRGNSSSNNGVVGMSAGVNTSGVYGYSSSGQGYGVQGYNTVNNVSGGLGAGVAGVSGMAPLDTSHFGLFILGRAAFQTSTVLTVAKNKSSVSAPYPAIGASVGMPTVVLATLQTNRNGVYIQAAVANPTAGKITVYLNKKVTAATKVAVFVLN